MTKGQFDNPELPTPERLEQLLQGNQPEALTEALIGLALGSSDLDWAFRVITSPNVTGHADAGVRGAAVLSLGHLARIHRHLPVDPSAALIQSALNDPDPWVRGQAENALSDVGTYAPEVAKVCQVRIDHGSRSESRG